MMSLDEEDTLVRLNAFRAELFDPTVTRFGGRTIKLMGDGALCEFPSAVAAVRCASEILRGLAERNCTEPQDRALQLRIGVTVGDLIVQGQDLYGNGINIAARLESIAQPGDVLISQAAYEQVKSTEGLSFLDLGEQRLKNILEPVRVYRVTVGHAPISSSVDTRYLLSKPAVAVLPFTNLSGDPEQEYFADGLTEDLITTLSLWKEFPVIAPNSTFTYKGKAVDVRQVSRELGARYILEGSVRKAGDRVRVTAQLLDGGTAYQIWADKLDRRMEDIFAVQDELTQQIASIIEPAISKAETQRGLSTRVTTLSAWDFYQRGIFYFNQFTPQAADQARDFFLKATEADPSYAPAFAGLARSLYVRIMLGQTPDHKAAVEAAKAAARRAVAIDDTESFAHMTLGLAHMWSGDHDPAIAELERAVQCNPSNSVAHIVYGNVLDVAGRPEEGIPKLFAGIRLNPLNPWMHQAMTWLAGAYLNGRRYVEALEWIGQALLRDANYPLTHLLHSIALAHTGEFERAKAALEYCERIGPGFVQKFVSWRPYRRPEDNDHMIEGIQKAGWQG